MITLAVDTSEARGSVAILHDENAIAQTIHEQNVDYSEWLLPSAEGILNATGIAMPRVELLTVATGPGSFTGLRVGLATVKAWAEVYGKPVVGVTRLEAMAGSLRATKGLVAGCYDAQRGQLFGGLYRAKQGEVERIGDEVVIAPEGFLEWVEAEAGQERVSWISLDPELITSLVGWRKRVERGDTMKSSEPGVATAIGILGARRARRGEFSDALELDANYVRRSDAEIFWKGR